jgi:hypothetical protein
LTGPGAPAVTGVTTSQGLHRNILFSTNRFPSRYGSAVQRQR